MNSKDGWAWVGADEFAAELQRYAPTRTQARAKQRKETYAEPLPFEIVLGGKPIQLTPIEYQLVLFLAKRPYYAFTSQQILEGVPREETDGLTEENLSDHIRSLRGKMGFFRDYVQTVPHIGYRFKP